MEKEKPKLQPRHKMLAFYGVPSDTGTVTLTRMRKFTQLSQSKNPVEYNRQYTDEPVQQTDVVGYAPSLDYAFDKHRNLPVHQDMIKITNHELVGDDAVRQLVLVDTDTNEAISRDYAVIPNTEGDNINVYTHSGTFKCKGDKVLGTATSNDNWETITFEEAGNT